MAIAWLKYFVAKQSARRRGFSPGKPREIRSGQTRGRIYFPPSTSVFPSQYNSTKAPYSSASKYYYFQTENPTNLGIYTKEMLFPTSEVHVQSSKYTLPAFREALNVLCTVNIIYLLNFSHCKSYIHIYIYIQGVTGGTDQTSGECSLGQTIPI